MSRLPKFGGPESDPDREVAEEFVHPDRWMREEFPGGTRLVVGAREGEIPLILDLCRDLDGPFGILYVAMVPYTDREPGRYQSPEPLLFDELERLLTRFRDFFEQDGRHHVWIHSIANDGTFIFDRHNMIFMYGDLGRIVAALEARGFSQGPVHIPAPHTHWYHPEFHQDEQDLFDLWEWIGFQLQESHDI